MAVRVINWKFVSKGKKYFEYSGTSEDEKPTNMVATGSLFHEVDTAKVYAYDEGLEDWIEQCALGGDA